MRPAVLVAAAAAAVGVALRASVLGSSLSALDGDEAVWGLMARHALDGELTAFYWAQEYGGTQETILTAGVFALAGSSTLALRVVPMVLAAAAAVLVWRVGRRTVGDAAGLYAAALVWVWPAHWVWKSTRAHGFYGSGLVLSLLALLLVVRLQETGARRDAALLGLVLGLGLWATPQVGLVALPAFLWLVLRRPRVLRHTHVALPAFVLGALPWLVSNARHGWYSFDRAVDAEAVTALGRLKGFFASALPTLLGLRVPYSLEWVVGAALGWTLYGAALIGFAWAAVRSVRRRSPAEPLVAVGVAYPLLFSLSTFAWMVDDPRYLVFLLPVAAHLLGALLDRAGRPAVAAAGVAAAAALSVAGLAEMRDQARFALVDGRPAPRSWAPLVERLEAEGVERAVADYFIAYPVTFVSRERVIATPAEGSRYPRWERLVAASPRVAEIAVAGSAEDEAVRARRPAHRRVEEGMFAVYLPPD